MQELLSSNLPQRRGFLHPQVRLRTALHHVAAIGKQTAQLNAFVVDVEEGVYSEDLLTVRLGIIWKQGCALLGKGLGNRPYLPALQRELSGLRADQPCLLALPIRLPIIPLLLHVLLPVLALFPLGLVLEFAPDLDEEVVPAL